jgi:UDP:flavonoid glycosyltransferase YjiC (YdhE family)
MPVAKKQDARPTLYLSPSQFELPGQLDLSAHYTEPAIYLGGNADRGEIDWQTVDPNAPLVYCTLGNQVDSYPDVMRLYQQILVAAESAPEYHFIISAGTLSEKLMPWLKPNTSIYSYVHSAQVLAKASAAIIHGGFGTIKECIWFRVPMLVYPQMWDQPLNARRVEFHGLGVNAGRSPLSSDGILEAVRSLLRDTQVKDRLYEMQSVFQKSEAGQRSAQVCEELLSGRTAVAIGSDRAIA